MSADGWETVTDSDSLRHGEPLRVLGVEGWVAHIRPGSCLIMEAAGLPRALGATWLTRALCERGQVERRAEPEPHPDDVALVRRLADLGEEGARYVVQCLAQQRRERGES